MYSVLNMSDLRNVKFLNHKAFVNDVYANGFHDESDFAICFAMEHGDSMLVIPMLEYLEMSHKVHGFSPSPYRTCVPCAVSWVRSFTVNDKTVGAILVPTV